LGESNACRQWIKEMCHGRDDVTLLVYQTFVDPQCELPVLREFIEITDEHEEWAEHTLLLYLERGGLSAVHVFNLEDPLCSNPRRQSSKLEGCGASTRSIQSMPVLRMNNFLTSVSASMKSHRSAGNVNMSEGIQSERLEPTLPPPNTVPYPSEGGASISSLSAELRASESTTLTRSSTTQKVKKLMKGFNKFKRTSSHSST